MKKKRKNYLIGLFLIAMTSILGYSNGYGQSISPPKDGVSFEVVKTYSKIEADLGNCGYTDIGTPKMAKVTYQTRRYQERSNGKVTRTWMENRRIKSECLPNQ